MGNPRSSLLEEGYGDRIPSTGPEPGNADRSGSIDHYWQVARSHNDGTRSAFLLPALRFRERSDGMQRECIAEHSAANSKTCGDAIPVDVTDKNARVISSCSSSSLEYLRKDTQTYIS
jgi:hypothetical protein